MVKRLLLTVHGGRQYGGEVALYMRAGDMVGR